MSQDKMGAIFQATDPNYGKSDSEIFQDRVRQMKMQNFNRQLEQSEKLQGQIDKTPAKEFNKGGAVAAALGDMFAPESNTFSKYMTMNEATPDKRSQLQDRLEKSRAGANAAAKEISLGMDQGSGLQGQIDLANLRQKNAKELFDYKKSREAGALGELTPGQKKVDTSFAVDHQKWTSGGYANTQAQIKKMGGVLGRLQPGQPEMGGRIAHQKLRALYEPEVVGLEQDIESITFQSLKEILGGNFTKGEADRMVAQAYDPMLTNEQNRKKISDSLNSLSEKMEAKQAATAYFTENNGSLKGFRGLNLKNMKDYNNMLRKDIFGADAKDLKDSEKYVFDEDKKKGSEESKTLIYKSDAAKNLAKEFGL